MATSFQNGLMSIDAVIVPGGGQLDDCTLPKQVQLRYDAALQVYAEAFRANGAGSGPVIISLSAGTPHKPNPRDAAGFDSKESTVGTRYVLMRAGLLPRPDGTVANDVSLFGFRLSPRRSVSSPHGGGVVLNKSLIVDQMAVMAVSRVTDCVGIPFGEWL
jgi:hypothetical protein